MHYGGWHDDTICTVEIKTHEGEISYLKDSKKWAHANSKGRQILTKS